MTVPIEPATGCVVVCAFPQPEASGPRVAGHVLGCQLCPASPTYWRGEPTASACRYDKPTSKKPSEGDNR